MDLNKNIEVVSNHSSTCGGKCSITREGHREGLASILEIACSKCKKTWQIDHKCSAEIDSRYSVNVGAVWGRMSLARDRNI